LWNNMEEYGRAGEATDGNTIRHMGIASWITKGHKYTLRIWNVYCFSTGTIFTRKLLNITLHLLLSFIIQTGCVPTVQPTRFTCYLKLNILVKRSTCFGRSFHLSSGAQNCLSSNCICQTAAATCCYRGWDGCSSR
jgi:hypothetical protein